MAFCLPSTPRQLENIEVNHLQELNPGGFPMQGAQVGSKEAILMAVCSRSFEKGRTIVFFRTKQAAHRAKMLFGLANLPLASELHGNMTQAARLEALEKFRQVSSLLWVPW